MLMTVICSLQHTSVARVQCLNVSNFAQFPFVSIPTTLIFHTISILMVAVGIEVAAL